MDKEHWIKLDKVCWMFKYLLPKEKCREIFNRTSNTISPSSSIFEIYYDYFHHSIRIPQLIRNWSSDGVIELLCNPEYDLKEWEDG